MSEWYFVGSESDGFLEIYRFPHSLLSTSQIVHLGCSHLLFLSVFLVP